MDYYKKYLKYKMKYLYLLKGGYDFDLIEYIKSKSIEINDYYNSHIFVDEHDLEKLNININLEEIKHIYESNKYIQLRRYNNEKILIIGCGNGRLDCGNLEPCYSESYKVNYDKYHMHEDAFTIDLTLVANPSIVSEFNQLSNYSTLPDHTFDFIIFERGGDPKDNPEEIKRLLNNNKNSYCIHFDKIYSHYIDGQYFLL
jgi:hypothetical protein